jgi:hypothetical protein
MGIFNDGMYTEEEVTRIKEIYRDIGWLIRDFEEFPVNLRGTWMHEYAASFHCFKDYEFEIIARELTKCFQGYGYKAMYRKTEFFDELYVVEVEAND